MLTRRPDFGDGVPAHILVVDDDSMGRQFASTVLEKARYRVSTAASASAALALIGVDLPDLLVLDFNLPDQNGDAILRQLRTGTEGRDVPVIFLSGDDSTARFRSMMELGADDYLVKPVRPRELADAVTVQFNKYRRRHRAQLPSSRHVQANPAGVPSSFQVLGKLAQGASAIAYRARRLEDGADCVVKVIALDERFDASAVARFTREGLLLERLHHPGIVHSYGHGMENGHAYLATEYIGGGTMRPLLGEAWESNAALRFLLQIAEALAVAHDAGIVHRDLKPENLMLRPQSVQPVLADFGIAKDLLEHNCQTRKGVILGTPNYLAPELITGQPVSPATDIYACGAIFHEMLTGKKPYHASSLEELLRAHLRAPPPALPEPCAHLQPLLNTLLAKRAADRPVNGAALTRMLKNEIDNCSPILLGATDDQNALIACHD